MLNGDLHVDFRKAEVADTVCSGITPSIPVEALTIGLVGLPGSCKSLYYGSRERVLVLVQWQEIGQRRLGITIGIIPL